MINIIILSQGMIFLPILASVLIYIFNNKVVNYLAFIVQGIITVFAILMWEHLINNGVMVLLLGGWQREIGIELRIDNLSMLFISMAVIIWWVVLIYSWAQKKYDFKFIFFLLFLEGSFIAISQVNDFFTFFVLIEIITILSTILILYKKDGISIKAGLYYLLFNSFGMMIYLLGLSLLYLKVGTLNMTLIKEYLIQIDITTSTYSVIKISYVCFFVSMCVKAALFPVYEWLPRAHTAAPAYISALLSGLLVKTGLFGLIKIMYVFNFTQVNSLLFYLGFFTAITGILFAVSQKDIKAILAFHTISQIGLIVMSLASSSDVAMAGAYTHIFNHFLFKSLLFLSAGIIINEYKVRRVTEIRGIFKIHPILSICMFVGILSITGAPFFVGFLSKSLIKASMANNFELILFRIVGLGTMVSFVKFSKIFFGKAPPKRNKVKKSQVIAILILTVLCIVSFFNELDFLSVFYSINKEIMSANEIKIITKITSFNYVLKGIIDYLLMLVAAMVIYKYLVKPESKLIYKMRHFRMKFQDAMISIVFFMVIVFYFV